MKKLTNRSTTKTSNKIPARSIRDDQEHPSEEALPEKPAKPIAVAEKIQPRIIRLKDASRYLGMDRNRFNREVRPGLVKLPIGRQGVGFDRLDLDAWVDAYKHCNGAPGGIGGNEKCEIHPDLDLMESNGSSTSASNTRDAYSRERALAKKRLKKR